MTYQAQYDLWHRAVEDALEEIIDTSHAPEPLRGAMRYSLLAGGKRLRPVLLLAACDAGGGNADAAMPYACALEMIHTYSLIHDDLPAMDDDDLRRGRPTNHKVFGEGMAILAGDGLLNLAYETMLSVANTPGEVEAMRRIAVAAGAVGMVGGQCVDLTCETSGIGGADELTYIHLHKTADLFIAAIGAGLSLAGAEASLLAAGTDFARAVGTAFQIRDDLLDIEGDAQALGKATGMDALRGKLTWPGLFGVAAAHEAVREKTAFAMERLDAFGEKGWFLREAAAYMLLRDR